MIELKNNYQDDVLDSTKNQLRKYNMIHNDDGTVSFVDATVYSQNGDNFGAKDVNDIVARIGEVAIAKNNSFDKTISGMNAGDVQGAIDEIKGTIGYSRKNLLVYPYVLTTVTQGNVTFTDVGDGTISTSGVSTSKGSMILADRTKNKMLLKAGTYTISGCPKGGSPTTYMINVSRTVNGAGELIAQDIGNGCDFTLTEDTYIGCLINIEASGINMNGLTFYPMIRYASIEDDTFEPYVEDVQTQIDSIETQIGGATYLNLSSNESNITGAPWKVIKAQYNSLPTNKVVFGRIYSAGPYACYIGIKVSDQLGSFMILQYHGLYHAYQFSGKWYKKAVTEEGTEF